MTGGQFALIKKHAHEGSVSAALRFGKNQASD
jgi:hypothetical protein